MTDGARDSLLGRICAVCLERTGAESVAVAVVTADGHRGTAYASDDTAARLEDAGFVLGEGPNADAFTRRGPVLAPDLDLAASRQRWPAFTAVADECGIGSIFAFPLQLGAVSIGTLTLYGRRRSDLDGPQLKATLRAADDAVLALLGVLAGADPVGGFDDAIYRVEVHQAAGMLAEQLHVTVVEALVRLRAHAFATGRAVDEVGRAVVLRQLRFEGDNDQRSATEEPDDD